MFEQALKITGTLPEAAQAGCLKHLDAVRRISHNFGYGVGDDVEELLAKYGGNASTPSC